MSITTLSQSSFVISKSQINTWEELHKMSSVNHFLHHEVGHVERTKTVVDSKMNSHVEETQNVLKGLE